MMDQEVKTNRTHTQVLSGPLSNRTTLHLQQLSSLYISGYAENKGRFAVAWSSTKQRAHLYFPCSLKLGTCLVKVTSCFFQADKRLLITNQYCFKLFLLFGISKGCNWSLLVPNKHYFKEGMQGTGVLNAWNSELWTLDGWPCPHVDQPRGLKRYLLTEQMTAHFSVCEYYLDNSWK